MLDCPAGFVEYRKKFPYLEAFHWDRCDFLEHGKKIPQPLTDIDRPTGADVNAGLSVKPNKRIRQYDQRTNSPLNTWMGPDKNIIKDFTPLTLIAQLVWNLLKIFTVILVKIISQKDFLVNGSLSNLRFKVGLLIPVIHLVFIWPHLIQNLGSNNLSVSILIFKKNTNLTSKKIVCPSQLKKKSNQSYENISYSYEIFNEVIIWGMVNFPELKDYFLHKTEIHGTKISFDRDLI